MKKIKMLLSISLVIIIIFSFAVSSMALVSKQSSNTIDEAVLIKSVEPLISEQSKYYNITKKEITSVSSEKKDGKISTTFNLDLSMCLKFKEPSDFPFVKGMLNSLGLSSISEYNIDTLKKLVNSTEFKSSPYADFLSSSDSNDKVINAINKEIFGTKSQVEEYIGKTSTLSYSFLVTTLEDGTILDVKILNFNEYVPMKAFFPDSEEIMMKQGEEKLITSVKNALASEQKATIKALSPLYYRVNAREYAKQYSSNATSSDVCAHGRSYIDHSHYNNSVYNYYCGVDCANYVSQSIYAGSMPTDSTWYAGSTAWISVNDLRNYFLNTKGYWNTSNYTNANAGGVIFNIDIYGNRYHVNMIVLNDTLNRAYAAHNKDRSNMPYTSSYWGSETQEYYVFNNCYPA